ncbi:MAG: phosphatidate cytidylyltransferase [Bacteroidetes bacterium]|nr:phosphatidate cytidylyltransferase [Bacteroidota bacterium]
MNSNIVHTLILGGLYLALFAIAELLYHKLKVTAEHTRKIVHVFSGLIALSFPVFIDSIPLVGVLCGGFLLILIWSMRFDKLHSIHKVDRKTYGSILFPIVVFACYIIANQLEDRLYFYMPLIILAVCDPLAALVGKKFPIGKFSIGGSVKTVMGSAVFILSAFLITMFLSSITWYDMNEITTFTALAVAVATGIAEGVTHRGYDNISVPLTAVLVLYLINHFA